MTVPLTARRIEALKPKAERYEVGDAAAPGLRLRVLPSGAKVFRWYTLNGGARKVITLGHWSATALPGHVTLHQAREELDRLKEAQRAGQLGDAAQKLSERLKPPPEPSPAPGATLFAEVAEDFYTRRIAPHRKRPLVARKMLDADILPVIGRLPIEKITTLQCARLVEKVVDRPAPVHAGKVLGLLKQAFKFAEARGYIDRNPAAPLEPAALGVANNVSQRWLNADEIRAFWTALQSTTELAPARHEHNTMHRATKTALELLLLTGVRSCELLLARWEHLDLEASTWSVPVSNQKLSPRQAQKSRPWIVPLCPMALKRFELLKELAGGSPWVMASERDSKAAYTEKALARAMRRLWRAHPLLKKLEEASPHDLRRSLRTWLGKLRVPLHIVERCLNHSLGRIVQIYDVGDYLDERREALARWEVHLEGLLAGESKVVALTPGVRS